MSINFVPNDPGAVKSLPLRKTNPGPDRPTSRAHFSVAGAVPESQYDVGTPEFLYWQCREAALAAAETWEGTNGSLGSWHESKTLAVFPDLGEDLNAYYDRRRGGQPEGISFFHQKVGNKTYFSGASTDVVAHETGHALLDSVRPDFWGSARFEVNSFHEAFGDCIAILTALGDNQSRIQILKSLTTKNVVESTAEELAEGIRSSVPGHNAGEPRHARNKFQWGPPGSIPINDGPGKLIYEVHSFGQVFSGCFYDTIVNIFQGLSSQSDANLLKAAQTAGKLLVLAAKQAPQRAEFFREVGQAMILNDEQESNGDNRAAIRDSFEAHGIALAAGAMIAPRAALSAAAPRGAVAKARIAAPARNDLLRMFGAPAGMQLVQDQVKIAGDAFKTLIHQKAVPLGDIDKRLKGVVAMAPQVALVGKAHSALAVLGHISNAEATVKDVEAFAESLVKHGRIAFKSKPRQRRPGARGAVARGLELPSGVTHAVQEIRGQKTLVRLRFACSRGR